MDVPIFVKDEFGAFYKAMFEHQVEKEGGRATFLEYAWDMSWCDPCAADPLSVAQLRELGAFWLAEAGNRPQQGRMMPGQPQPVNAFVTRLHLRYTAETHPQDLQFQITGDRENWQGRYILRHPYTGDAQCEGAEQYRASLPARFAEEARTLASLTGWEMAEIEQKMAANGQDASALPKPRPWWDRLWD